MGELHVWLDLKVVGMGRSLSGTELPLPRIKLLKEDATTCLYRLLKAPTWNYPFSLRAPFQALFNRRSRSFLGMGNAVSGAAFVLGPDC